MAKWLKLYATYTFSTSPNLRYRTTLLIIIDVPNCHTTLELTIESSYVKLKYGLFSRAVSSTTYRLNIVRIYARNVPRVH